MKYPVPQKGDKFLWIRFGAFGDLLEALADAYSIKQKFPYIKLSFMTLDKYVEIVQSQPYVDEVIVGEKTPLAVMFQTAKLMRMKKYDWVGSTFKGGHMPIMAWLSGIKNRLGDTSYWSFLQTANIYDWTKACGINLFRRTEKSLFATDSNIQFAKKILAPLEGKKKIFCVIGSNDADKMWPLSHWIELLKPLAQENWGIVINGYGTREEKMAGKIQTAVNSDNVLNLVSKYNIMQLIAVAGECQLAVGNDSGPLHAAALCGVPSVGIFDYIPPKEIGFNAPWVTSVIAINENLQTFYAKRRNGEALAEITPEIVRRKIDELAEKWTDI